MISLRSLVTLTTVVASALAFAACSDNSTNPLGSGLQPTSANFNSSKSVTGAVDARVLLDKSGNAILEVHAGTFNDATNTATPSGTISSLTYTVKDGANKNKTITTHTVSFSKTVSSYFFHLSLCQSSGDDEDDDDGSGQASSCNTHWGSQYTLTFTANLKGLGSDGKSTGTGSGTAAVFNLPDIDLSQQNLFIMGAGGTQTPATSVSPSTPTTFTVPFPNNKVIGGVANAVGAQTVCVVTVDGFPQLPLPNGVYNKYLNPNAFGYVGSATENISAGSTGSCDFTLSLPAGTHKIVVTAGVLYPGDYDLSNNSTQTFTVNSAVSGPPDIMADVLHQSPDAPLDTPPIVANATTPITLKQWVTLVSGAQPGTVTCTLTVLNTTTNVTTTASGTVTTTLPAACSVPVLFATPGIYKITSLVSTPSSLPDPSLTNNTAVNTVTVSSGPPSATVTVTKLSFSDATTGAASDLSTTPGVEDQVYAGDVVTYTAAVSVVSLINTTGVNVTCKAVDGAADITGLVKWLPSSTLTGVAAGTACAFKYAFPFEADNASHTHNITVSVTTPGSTNNATSSTSLTGAIKDLNAVDIVGLAIQRVGNGTTAGATAIISFDTTTYGKTVTINGRFSNPSTLATAIDCTINADPSLTPQAVGTVKNVPLPAGGTVICQYTVLPTLIGPYAVSITAVPSSGSPVDLNVANNTSTASPVALSTGAFQILPVAQSIVPLQDWDNPPGDPSFPISQNGALNEQVFTVTDLALIVVPNQAVLGQFSMSGTVTSGVGQSIVFGTGTAPFQQLGQSDGSTVCVGSQQTAPLNNPLEPALSYTAQICSTPVDGRPGFQAVTVSYSQTAGHVAGSASPLLFASSVVMKINLNFSLVPGATAPDDHVQATITVPVMANVGPSCVENLNTPPTSRCSTIFGTATITTP